MNTTRTHSVRRTPGSLAGAISQFYSGTPGIQEGACWLYGFMEVADYQRFDTLMNTKLSKDSSENSGITNSIFFREPHHGKFLLVAKNLLANRSLNASFT